MTEIKLSNKQKEILKFINDSVALNGRAPTYREIAQHFKYAAVGTVQDHVRALEKKGFLKKDEKTARGFSPAYHAGHLEIPILGRVPAGSPLEVIEDVSGTVSVPFNKRSGEYFALRVQGDSMIDAGIFEGDIVVIRKQHEANNGDIVVALLDGEATVKTLEKKEGRLRLLPANPKYKPINLMAEAYSTTIQGKVVSVQRFY